MNQRGNSKTRHVLCIRVQGILYRYCTLANTATPPTCVFYYYKNYLLSWLQIHPNMYKGEGIYLLNLICSQLGSFLKCASFVDFLSFVFVSVSFCFTFYESLFIYSLFYYLFICVLSCSPLIASFRFLYCQPVSMYFFYIYY